MICRSHVVLLMLMLNKENLKSGLINLNISHACMLQRLKNEILFKEEDDNTSLVIICLSSVNPFD